MDITQLILDDHHEQRRLFAILEQIDRSDTEALSAVWGRLSAFLEVHAAAEEAIFYPVLLQAGIAARRRAGVEDETLDAISDHNEIRDAVTEVARHPAGSDGWYAAIAGANRANGDHMAEEEREGLTDFRRLAGLQQRHHLAVAFAAYEARNFAGVRPVDKDPAAYVSQAEEGTGPGGDGSLRIGGREELGSADGHHRYQRPRPRAEPSPTRTTKPTSQSMRTMSAIHHRMWMAKPSPPRMRASRRTSKMIPMRFFPSGYRCAGLPSAFGGFDYPGRARVFTGPVVSGSCR